MKNLWLSVVVMSAIVLLALIWSGTRDDHPSERGFEDPIVAETDSAAAAAHMTPTFVGGAVCATCHADESVRWSESHHDLAMQHANEDTVLGDFSDSEFVHFDVTSTFFMDGGRFMVRTDGPGGELSDYEIKYTFGVTPLQQYLIEFPDGRIQALSIAWDSRSSDQGGQQWFHLYPDEPIPSTDSLHWTRPSQNWNYMCAECHSTRLGKNYDADTDRFDTTWSEIDVSCEACHGPASAHVDWAASGEVDGSGYPTNGLMLAFDERRGVSWPIDPDSGSAVRSEPNSDRKEIEVCARCHSRRGILSEEYVHGQPLMNTHRPALLADGLYFPDGQIQDEVYVYGSFLQSKMFHAGVTCSDCHEPHSLKLRAPGNDICLGCHSAERFAAPTHHFHEQDSPGAQCVACHMPEKTYMVVDPRRDHSIRIPRPDLSVLLGTPNACTGCHEDRPDEWAAAQVAEWYGEPSTGYQKYAIPLFAGRIGAPEAPELLIELLANEEQPAIARAAAVSLLGGYQRPELLQAISDSLYDEDPLVRLGGLQALEGQPANVQLQLAQHLLDDPVLAVRIETGRLLAAVPANALKGGQGVKLKEATSEYVAALQLNADRADAQANLGNFHVSAGKIQEAESAFLQAIDLDRLFAGAYLNLADLYRQTARELKTQIVLRQGLDVLPEVAALHHALGLALVRAKNLDAAAEALALAAELQPENPRNAYVYAIALDALDDTAGAIAVLEQANSYHPYDQPILEALVSYSQKTGSEELAAKYAERLDNLRRRPAAPRD